MNHDNKEAIISVSSASGIGVITGKVGHEPVIDSLVKIYTNDRKIIICLRMSKKSSTFEHLPWLYNPHKTIRIKPIPS